MTTITDVLIDNGKVCIKVSDGSSIHLTLDESQVNQLQKYWGYLIDSELIEATTNEGTFTLKYRTCDEFRTCNTLHLVYD